MATQLQAVIHRQDPDHANGRNEGSFSAVSWAAIAAGAFVSAALFLILLAFGTGAGLSSLSPWASGVSPSTVGVGALLFLAISELISSSIGGYLAGRLRTKWVDVHSDEVYFRDTAHGFLVWAVALVISAAFLTSAAGAMVGAESRNNNSSRPEGPVADANRYYIDSLFRSAEKSPNANDAERAEVGLIFAHSLRNRGFAPDDRNYVIEKLVARTGLSHMDAEKRIDQVFASDQQAADTARKAVAHVLYWLFVALLLGAFCASFAATLGGKQRDHVRAVAIRQSSMP
jgi:hypothetical protein